MNNTIINGSTKSRLADLNWQNLMKEFSLKNIKTPKGMEGEGLEANVYHNGVKVGSVWNYGDGGPNMDDLPKNVKDRLNQLCESLPMEGVGEGPYKPISVNNEIVFEFLAHYVKMTKKVKRATYSKILVEVHSGPFSDNLYEYKFFQKGIPNPIPLSFKEGMEKEFPNKDYVIWNEIAQ